jgi:hypothetical protein
MIVNVNNGERVEVSLPDFEGVAGFLETPKGASLSYLPNKAGRLNPGAKVSVAGREWAVMSVRRSDYARDLRVVSLKEAGNA